MASTFHSTAINLEAVVKNINVVQPTWAPPPATTSTDPKQYNEHEKSLIARSTEIYDTHLDKYKFKGLTRELYIQMHLMGGFEEYMDKVHPGHTISKALFSEVAKTGNIKFYQ
jgi:hypothetical protein